MNEDRLGRSRAVRSAGQDGGWGRVGGPGEGGAAWAPAAAACPAPPAREVSCCNQSPVCVGLELELEPEQERPGGEGKEAAAGVFSWRRPRCRLLTTRPACLTRPLASPGVWVLSVSVPSSLYISFSSCLGL